MTHHLKSMPALAAGAAAATFAANAAWVSFATAPQIRAIAFAALIASGFMAAAAFARLARHLEIEKRRQRPPLAGPRPGSWLPG